VSLMSPRIDKAILVRSDIAQLPRVAQHGTEPRDAPSPWCDWGSVAWAYHMRLTRPSKLDVCACLATAEDCVGLPLRAGHV
jgi:hypothetical protein